MSAQLTLVPPMLLALTPRDHTFACAPQDTLAMGGPVHVRIIIWRGTHLGCGSCVHYKYGPVSQLVGSRGEKVLHSREKDDFKIFLGEGI